MKRRVVTIVLAALLAVVGAGAVLTYVHQANKRAVAGEHAVSVYTATGPISAGTKMADVLKQHLAALQQFPAASLPTEALRYVSPQEQKLVLTASIAPGQVLTRSLLGTTAVANASGILAIPPGQEAVTIQVCLPAAVAGYVEPGSQVSIFDTYLPASPKGAKPSSLNVQETCDVSHQSQAEGAVATRVLLPKVTVLAVGQSPASQGSPAGITSTVASGSGSAQSGAVLVTLAVDQAKAEKVILVAETGLPYMALLSGTAKPTYDPRVIPLFQPVP